MGIMRFLEPHNDVRSFLHERANLAIYCSVDCLDGLALVFGDLAFKKKLFLSKL